MQTLADDSIVINASPENTLSQDKFDEFLVEAIDEVLTSLGLPVKNSLYFHLQNDFGIEKNCIPQQICEFSRIIHKIFGLGASRLEIKIVEKLNSKLKLNSECPQYEWSKWIVTEMSFTENIGNLRKSLQSSGCLQK